MLSDKLIVNSDLSELEVLSSRLGNNPMLVQGAGGNTSIKNHSTLWIKASGKRLADALREPIFIAMDRVKLLTKIAHDEHDLDGCALSPESKLRPSIETSIHALMPHRVVIHVHSIRALSWACYSDITELMRRLDGLSCEFISYCRPGMPLTNEIIKKTNGVIPDVLILGNHGLIVAAESCDKAEQLLLEVETRMENYKRESPAYNFDLLKRLVTSTPYRLPKYSQAHDLANDYLSFNIATKGSLYPDHVVFLGRGVVGIKSLTVFKKIVQDYSHPPLLLIESIGALVSKGASEDAEEMILALALVSMRMQSSHGLRYLTFDQESELCSWEAELFRKNKSNLKQ
jgi:rhamnose utilization protein RhaD (predicted bifunctional aldolase and dehydrogenase)